ncbi:MAG: hypothetical protein GY742_22870 [Hyphomicrobiales bacterium]|nr:hypothetical protein [Hyphomicrobiales bacterium]
MDQSSSLSKARNPEMFLGDLVIGQVLRHYINWADELDWFTKGRLFTHSGQRYDFLVVIKTKAKTMPCQKT